MGLGAATLMISSLFQQGLGLLTLGVVARILSPADLGTAAYFLIAAAFIELLQRQLPLVLVKLKEVTPDHIDTVFTLQVLCGLLLSGLFLAITPLVEMSGVAAVVSLLPAAAAYAVLAAFRSPRAQLLERDLRFGYGAAEDSVSRVVYAMTAIFLLLVLRDYWALVWATFAAQATRVVWTFSIAPMRPRLTLARWRENLAFSLWAIPAQMADLLILQLPQLVIGLALGLRDAGIFRLANSFIALVTIQLAAPMLRVLYPGLAEVSRDHSHAREAFMRSNEVFLGVMLPFAIGLALLAEDAIRYGLGEQWVPAAQVIWALALLQALTMLQSIVRAAAYVADETRTLFYRNMILLAVTAGLLVLGAQFGFQGMIAAVMLSNLTSLLLTLLLARRYGSDTFFSPLLRGWRSFLASAVMAVAVLGVGALPGPADPIDEILRIGAGILVGMIVYPLAHLALWRLAGRPDGFESFLLSMLARLRGRLRRS